MTQFVCAVVPTSAGWITKPSGTNAVRAFVIPTLVEESLGM
jgi:hypothetical protein